MPNVTMSTKCFLLINDEEFQAKTKKLKNDNTEKSKQRAHRAFTNFLIAMGVKQEDTDYWNYTNPELDMYLAKVWFGARKETSETKGPGDAEHDDNLSDTMYKANSLRNFKYGLNRILRAKGHLYDITNKQTASFQKSQQAFLHAMKELKEQGKANVDSYTEITKEGR